MKQMIVKNIKDMETIKHTYLEQREDYRYQVLVCGGAGCVSSNCEEINNALQKEIASAKMQKEVSVTITGCMGTCAVGPVMLILPDNTFYTELTPGKVSEIVQSHLIHNTVL